MKSTVTRVGIVFLLLLLADPSCKTGAGVDGGSPIADGIVHCGEKATHDSAKQLLDDVASDLVSDGWEAELTALATRFTIAAVSCAVQYVTGSSNHNAQISGDKIEAVKAERGRAWLRVHPVEQ